MEAMELYRQWLKDFADDADTVADLKAIENDPKEIEDRFYKELEFGTAGMRGVLGAGTNRLNVYNVRRVSRALAKYILTTPDGAEKGVAIAYDSRRMSDVFAKQAALVLCNAGVKAFLFDSLRPVPVLSFHDPPPQVHCRHRHHRQPQPQAVQRLQGLLDRRRADAAGVRPRASPTACRRRPTPSPFRWTSRKRSTRGLLTYIG